MSDFTHKWRVHLKDRIIEGSGDLPKDLFKLKEENKIYFFEFYTVNKRKITVNLTDGVFKVGDYYLDLTDCLPRKESFRLIFIKRARAIATDRMLFNREALKPTYRYLIGWQTTIDGKNYQRILDCDEWLDEIKIKEKR